MRISSVVIVTDDDIDYTSQKTPFEHITLSSLNQQVREFSVPFEFVVYKSIKGEKVLKGVS